MFFFKHMPGHLTLGAKGERKALRYYKKLGYRVLEKNYRTGHQEIDIILLSPDCNTIIISEVKTRNELYGRLPREAVTADKQKNLKYAAQKYILNNRLLGLSVRFDVVEVYAKNKWKIVLLENAF